MHGSDHPHGLPHRLGIINHICPEGKWQAPSVFKSLWPQQGHLLWSPQDSHCGGSCPWICTLSILHKVGCLSWILVDHSWSGIQPTHNFQQPFWKILFPVSSLQSYLFSRHLPEEYGPDPRRVPRMYQNCRWHHCPWLHWSRTQCPPVEPHVSHPQIWVSIQPT